jgi:histidine phosphotransferase ChpT
MSTPIEIEGLDLAALIASRLCHDVISPVGAIVNGLEVLEEEKDPAMREIALDLVRKSAEQASARLQFARLAFGAAGSAGAQIDVGDAEQVAQGIVRDAKAEMSWTAPRVLLPKNKVKLLLNMLTIAMGTVPRGGTIVVTVEGNEPDTVFKIVTAGPMVRVANGVAELIAGTPADGRVDAHVIQPFYTGLIARESGMAVSIEMVGETVVMEARPAAAAAS